MLASFGIGSGVQVNAISNIMNNTFDLGTVNLFGQDASVISIIVGVLVAAITAVVIFGGIKSISRVCELLVPFMAVFYVLGCLIILGMNFDVLGKTFEMIFRTHFLSSPLQAVSSVQALCLPLVTVLQEVFSVTNPVWVLLR